MANRHTLSVKRLDEFKEWLENNGWQVQETKGFYEALRAVKEDRKNPLIVYWRQDTNNGNELVHYAVLDRDMGIIRQFLRR
jgi:hypothetical protein